MSKKSKVIASAVLVIIAVFFTLIGFFPRHSYHVNLTKIIEVKNGVTSPASFETYLETKVAGKYEVVAKWGMNPDYSALEVPGFISHFDIYDENGNVISQSTAGALTIEQPPKKLEKGKYRIKVTLLASQKEYEDFLKANSSDWDPVTAATPGESFFKDGTYEMHYYFMLQQDFSFFITLFLVGAVIIGLMLTIIVATLAVKSDSPAKKVRRTPDRTAG